MPKLNFQSMDNNSMNALEQIVELYYQCQGYITSSNKRIKKKKNYTDLDVLAINDKETLLIEVSTPMKSAKKVKEHFKCIENNLPLDLQWVLKNRTIRKIFVVQTLADEGGRKTLKNNKESDNFKGIELVPFEKIVGSFAQNGIQDSKGPLSVSNSVFKAIELFLKYSNQEKK